jgi:hypothetical protein
MSHLAFLVLCPSADTHLGVSCIPIQWWTWRALQRVTDDDLVQKQHLLREFLWLVMQLETMPESVVRVL